MWYFAAFVLGMHFGRLLGNIINRFYTEESTTSETGRDINLHDSLGLINASTNYRSMGRFKEAEECRLEAIRLSKQYE